ncbi:ATP-binding protein [Sphaerisporangium rubeum]|uniref:Anti-sigma regulatory factor (Ser/Thr protein kinase) n=1 Tax=Sphaerisporangium rubeum TaxID=321317 RepID=A0A7X0IHJ7_9ACTN|nr:ATP-binding protein [Sphaerisporangium rubeum]MBB6473787.1 anti-sigma regulatory factor (Ser/Thr protein kinase) [Sphaerisporangium rubeum]
MPSAPQQARDMALSAVLAWSLPVDPDELALVTGELVANAVTHAGTMLGVRIRTRDGAAVRVEVTDRDDRPPTLFAPGGSDESHWGLVVVAAIASRWGYERLTTGKVVWAEVDFAAEPLTVA